MIAGIILAAGRSSRLGRPKQLLPLHGEPLILYTARRALASSLDEVFVVVGHQGDEVSAALAGLPVHIVANPLAEQGQSTSVIAGVAALEDFSPQVEAAMFLLGDQPGVEPAVIDALIECWRATRAPVVSPRYRHGLGNPVLFDRDVFPELVNLKGDTGARSIVRAYQRAGSLLSAPVDFSAPPDIDTEEDYAALLRQFTDENENREVDRPPQTAPLSQRTGRGVGGEGICGRVPGSKDSRR